MFTFQLLCVGVCLTSLGPWLPWYLTPVFLPFFPRALNPDSAPCVPIGPGITQYLNVDYWTACSSEVKPGFYSHLIQNCKWKKILLLITPPPSPHPLVFSHRSVPSLTRSAATVRGHSPVLWCLTLNQTLLCCVWWQQQWRRMSARSPGLFFFLHSLPLSVSHAGLLRCSNVKCRSRCRGQQSCKVESTKCKESEEKIKYLCIRTEFYLFVVTHMTSCWVKIQARDSFCNNLFLLCKLSRAFCLTAWKHLLKLSVMANIAFCCIVCVLLLDNGLSFRACFFLLGFLVLDVPSVA